MARRLLIIANPAAGRERRGKSHLRRVIAALEQRGCQVALCETQGPGDAERFARTADTGFDLIVAAGGDGTVNEIANGLHRSARQMAVLPLGTGNVLANEIGMPRAPDILARVIAEAPAQPIWPGMAGGRLFVAMAGVGFDAEVLGALGTGVKQRFGKLAYIPAISRCLLRYRSREFIVRVAGGEQRAAAVIVVKGQRYAGNFVIAPAARLSQPMLHIVLFRRAGRIAAFQGLAALALGRMDRLPDVSILAAPSLEIAAATGSPSGPSPVEIDGEVDGDLPIAIGIAAAPLLLVQPPIAVSGDRWNPAAHDPV